MAAITQAPRTGRVDMSTRLGTFADARPGPDRLRVRRGRP